MLSIITINKNNSIGLENTFKSVLSQKVAEFEYIVIDGLSNDNSCDIIKKYENHLDYWSSGLDTGIYNAMNTGIRQAHGDQCLFLNSGDRFIADDIVVKLCKAFTPEVDILYSDVVIKHDGIKKCHRSPQYITPGYFLINTLNHQNTVIRRSLLVEEGLYREDLKIASDWYFFLRATSHRKIKFKYFPSPIVEYDNNGYSSSPEGAALNERERIVCINELFSGIEPIVGELKAFQDSVYGSIIRNYGNSKFLDLLLRIFRRVLRIFTKRIRT